jgi:hypothetical protein
VGPVGFVGGPVVPMKGDPAKVNDSGVWAGSPWCSSDFYVFVVVDVVFAPAAHARADA